MKIGDYVARIASEWQQHNSWMEFPNKPPVPLGIIVAKGHMKFTRQAGKSWEVLESSGRISQWRDRKLKVIDGSR